MTDARLIIKDGRQCPIPLKIAYVFFIVCAAMGEWSPINQKLYGLPKVLTVGYIHSGGICDNQSGYCKT